jgi:hypothetical protein
MEVHHHPQLHHQPKPWKEYLLEGLMIFIAVTLGFFAESYREHINDRGKEKEYMSSLLKELSYDTTEFSKTKALIFEIRPLLDSLYMNTKELDRFHYQLSGKWNMPVNEMNINYTPTLPTIEQLKSSGNLRLISDIEVVKGIVKYESLIKGSVTRSAASSEEAARLLFRLEDRLCDYSDFNRATDQNIFFRNSKDTLNRIFGYEMPVLFRDPEKINELANSMVNYKANLWGYSTTINAAVKEAVELMALIRKKYRMEKE